MEYRKENNINDRHTYFRVKCKCGKESWRSAYLLEKGTTKSCKSCSKSPNNVNTFITLLKNEGYDVYFVNPYFGEQICYLDTKWKKFKAFIKRKRRFKNIWTQGDHYHKGLIDFAQNIFDKLNYKIST